MNRQVVNTAHQWVSCGLVLVLKAKRALGRGPRAPDLSLHCLSPYSAYKLIR